jgi:carboxylate-amine ligase
MTSMASSAAPSAEELREVFDGAARYTVGLEDEVMLLEPETLELAPRAESVLSLMGEDPRFKLELPASQIEIITEPVERADDAAAALLAARRALAERAGGEARFAGAGVHPHSSGIGVLNRLARYEQTLTEYGVFAPRQLVCALQVHVAVPGAERSLAVYNAARSYLPLLAALAANGAFYEARYSALASVRPVLSELLPRQGIPPSFASWEDYAAALRWGMAVGAFPHPGSWWWELRPHPRLGTLEFRVPDAQSAVADVAGVAAVVQALAIWLGNRHDRGEPLAVPPTWQIEQNRWSACRAGVEGTMADLETGARRPTREVLGELLETLTPIARERGTDAALEQARRLVRANGAIRQREAAENGGAHAVTRWLAERFLEG